MSSLKAISPIDGRYTKATKELALYFSEEALIKYRVIVEGEYLIALSNIKVIRKLTDKEKRIIRALYKFTDNDTKAVKKYESKINHDVKAVEYFIKDKLKKTSLKDVEEFVHFGLTSEDVNNLSYGLLLREALNDVIIPSLRSVYERIDDLALEYSDTPMLSRTHGQSASPTTLGKEFRIFSARLNRQIKQLGKYRLLAKLNGASGNYNAHMVAFPKINWLNFSKKFVSQLNKVRGLDLEFNPITAQIEPHDTYAELFDIIRRANTILIDFNQDIWRYISDHWIIQKPKKGETGSSTMPHKVNPIDFENSEGNLGLANSLLNYFSHKLPISRLQRDLSDSTVERNFGVAFAHSLIAYKSTLKGLSKINANKNKIEEDLNNHIEVIAEAIQTILRKEGADMPYEQLKTLTRGKSITKVDFNNFIDKLSVSKEIKDKLKKITPQNYIGLAKRLAKKRSSI